MIEIIAECGVNHNGDINLAKEMIHAAAETGADTVKFQLFKTDELVSHKTPLADYQKRHSLSVTNQNELLSALSLTVEEHSKLIETCKDVGVRYLTSVFDTKSFLEFRNIAREKRVKLGSGEFTNFKLIKEIIESDFEIIMSTGMTSLNEVKEVLNFVSFIIDEPNELPTSVKTTAYGASKSNSQRISLLHCTSQYPAPISEINLKNIVTLQRNFSGPVGFSDHSVGITSAITAVGLDIKILEKHFTLDRSMPGPDHKASMEPKEFKKLVCEVRAATQALGSEDKSILDIEKDVSDVAKKSLIANTKILRGEKFSADNLTVKRPGTGISAKYYYDYLGKESLFDYNYNDLIK